MAIIVPILRVLFAFQNIFETFKTLKQPPPSARNGGKPTIRALSQRKRAMKGCMTTWLVWCCYATYEKTVDGFIGVFIPFYSEIKAIILLFFILTRARGTEPVYLHILRPMIKPYTMPLDGLVELTETFGDLVVLLCAIPFHLLVSVYHRITPWRRSEPAPKEDEPKLTPPVEKPAEVAKEQTKAAESTENGTTRSRRRPLQNAQTRSRTSQTVKATAATNGHHKPAADKQAHEIWYPPPPAYDESPPNEPVSEHPGDVTIEDWRKYEPFPAAYPPTPLPARAPLSVPDVPAQPPLGGISEDQSYYYSYIAEESVEVEEQGFHESLRSPRENPRSAGVLSDDDPLSPGVLGTDDDDEMDVEEEEDDFDVTLRTPALKRVQNMSHLTASSIDRDSNASTEFDTVYEDSPLQTRTNSEASATSASETASLAGTKRPISSVQEGRPLRQPLKDRLAAAQTIRPSRGPVRAPLTLGKMRTSSSSTSGAENKDAVTAAEDDTASLAPKRRRVVPARDGQAAPGRKPTMRVVTSVEGTGAKDTVVRKTTTVTSVPRTTQVRAPIKMAQRTNSSRSSGSGA